MKKNILILLSLSLLLSFAFTASAYAFAGDSTEYTTRVYGADRIETAIEISDYMEYSSSSGIVMLCTSANWPDALSVSGLAGVYDANILLNPPDELDERVKDELERIAEVHGGTIDVYIIGGTGAISEDIEKEIDDMNDVDTVERISGKDRYETCAKVAQEIYDHAGCNIDGFFVASGENWPDALSAAALVNNWSGW